MEGYLIMMMFNTSNFELFGIQISHFHKFRRLEKHKCHLNVSSDGYIQHLYW